ncbi:type ISP restriction/modification enzyme [Segatella hominis]|uniref:type ISP restriction/modification enzyme n=1 Tax=Segatella hominis TaxID=2518605 RepID=UPI001C45A6A3|nr:type ISP restriction/modification enzyme [Segatella hominis]WOZ80765.1 type ISP restriction/modification enzyme [Segatella hominis]
MNIAEYIKQINEQFGTGIAHEHSYRPMLQQLLGEMLPTFVVTNEPARIECGAPDFIISSSKTNTPVFYVEAKDIDDRDLDGRKENKEQFTRYKKSLDHIIFTDYLDFHLYENGEWVKNVRLAEVQGDNIVLCKENLEDFIALVNHIASTKPSKITSAKRLAIQMAAKARILASTINNAFCLAEEDSKSAEKNKQLQGQLDAFRKVLINDLTPQGFADIYAQTVAYGMFAARLHDNTPDNFSRQEAANLIPKTNPFLRNIFQQIAGYDLDERIAWIVDDLINVFLATDVQKVMKNYSQKGIHRDPMIHFYEDFLKAYNPSLRKLKGVWYTPQPVVQFIVRAVDEILQRDFELSEGLADYSKFVHEVVNEQYEKGEKKFKGKSSSPTIKQEMHRVQILDPATGTGTFLAEVVNQIFDKFNGMRGMWQGYVNDHLLPRLHGFELLMASYAVAHLKLDMLLQQTGFNHAENSRRLKIYLTNSLEEVHPDTGTLWAQWLSDEASAANRIKRDCPVMVMIGNPPYSGESQNKGEWIMRLLEDYKKEPGGKMRLNERNPKWINDDYVKFIRLAQNYVERNKCGIIGFINPHGFLDNPTFRGMRWNLLSTFDKIYTINLHGNYKKKEVCPNGSPDENVFDIQQGVSINLFIKTGEKKASELGKVYYYDLYGKREEKYDFLTNTPFSEVKYQELQPVAPMYFFVPKDFGLMDEYEKGVSISSLFSLGSMGITTGHDKEMVSLQSFKSDYNFQYSYRPFDIRWINYDVKQITRANVMNNLKKPNIALCLIKVNSSSDGLFKVLMSAGLTDKTILSSKDNANVFPLYLYTKDFGEEKKNPNLKKEEWQKFNDAVGKETTPEEILAYIYAVLHSLSYRERYKEFLKVDFPRIPLPKTAKEFNRLTAIGQQLIDLHLMNNTQSWKCTTTFPEVGSQQVDFQEWKDGQVWINDKQYFGNVSESVWEFYIGGYQPAQKWLKDRKGRTLSFDEIKHYLHIIHALKETERLMKEI